MADQAQKLRDMVKNPDSKSDVEMTSPSRQSRVQPVRKATVITVASGKGGVGKTNIAVNLGIALQQQGKKVAVIDMDLGMANVNVLTGVSPSLDLLDVFQDRHTIDEILAEGPAGIQIVAGASGRNELANLSRHDCEKLVKKLSQLDQKFDVLIVDTSAGVSRHVLQFVRAADSTLLVTTPEPTAITDAYALVKSSLRDRPHPNFKLVVNQASSILEGQNVADKIHKVSKEFISSDLEILGYVLEDRSVNHAVRSRKPFLEEYPDAQASQCVRHISRRLINPDTGVNPTGVEGFFESLVNWWG